MSHDTGISYWTDSAPSPARPGWPLPERADVVVIGGGIAGLTTAYALTEEGLSVVVLEARRIAEGTTGNTTAKVSVQHSLKYAQLAKTLGEHAAVTYAQSQSSALEWIAAGSAREGMDCDFERRDSYVYAQDPAMFEQLEREADAAALAGLPATLLGDQVKPGPGPVDIGLPHQVTAAVKMAGQAQFHPRRWLLALAERAEQNGCMIAEDAPVHEVDSSEGPDPYVVTCTKGTVSAGEVVVATHYPILDRGLFFARLTPVQELVVASPVDDPLPGIYLAADSGHSVRTAPLPDGRHLMIALGEHFRTGEHTDVQERYDRLEQWAGDVMGMPPAEYRWSAHDLSTPDGVPYIGNYHPLTKHLWVATGFGQWGMTGGTMAGLLLRDLITGRGSEWAELYDPGRVPGPTPAAKVIRDNLTVARYLVGDHARALLERRDPAKLQPGEAVVTNVGTRMVAAYRDERRLHAVSARCTHLGCLVAFNNADKTWDCPCHSSRFGLDGEVLNGPATRPLDRDALGDAT